LKIALACMDGRVFIYEALDVMNLSDWTSGEFFEAFGLTTSRLEPSSGISPGVRCLSWNPNKFDVPMLVVGGEGGDDGCAQVRVWKYPEATRKWEFVCDLEGYGGQVNDVSWAPNMGRSYHLIASAGLDDRSQLKVGQRVTVTTNLAHGLFFLQSSHRTQSCFPMIIMKGQKNHQSNVSRAA
jgi:nucleoporin SEH1